MNKQTPHRWLPVVFAAVVVFQTGLPVRAQDAAPGGDAKPAKKHESPQACFDAVLAAVEAKDFETLFACGTARAQNILTGANVMAGLGRMRNHPETAQQVTSLLNKHGLPLQDLQALMQGITSTDIATIAATLGEPITDKPGFMRAIVELTSDKEEETEGAEGKAEGDDAKAEKKEEYALKDLKVEGTKASAKLSTPKDDRMEVTILFEQIDGSWLVSDLKAQSKTPAPGTPGTPPAPGGSSMLIFRVPLAACLPVYVVAVK